METSNKIPNQKQSKRTNGIGGKAETTGNIPKQTRNSKRNTTTQYKMKRARETSTYDISNCNSAARHKTSEKSTETSHKAEENDKRKTTSAWTYMRNAKQMENRKIEHDTKILMGGAGNNDMRPIWEYRKTYALTKQTHEKIHP